MSAVTELGYVVFGVKDLERWKSFGSDFLGLELVDGETADRAYFRMDFWHHRYLLERDTVDDLLGLGLRVAGSDEFGKLANKLQAEGVPHRICPADEATERHVLELMRLEDPLGNHIEIFHGPFVQYDKPVHPGRRMYGKFATGSSGLGHCMLHGTDIRSMQRFYTLLGMRGDVEYKLPNPDGPSRELLFMHCNAPGIIARDHTIGLGFPGRKRLNHTMIESTDFNDVAYTYELAKKMNVPIVVDLGRHSNDHAYSFYVLSPSGFLMEYSWGSRSASNQTEYYDADFYGHENQPEFADYDLPGANI